MSGASFWAQKRDLVKSAASPTPTIAEQPKPAQTSSTSPGLVLKGMANGTPNGTASVSTPLRKKTDWAESEDDDDFYANFTAKKDPRIITLENEVTRQHVRIEELEAIVDVKHVRIEELEDAVQEKNQHIAGLEADIENMASNIESLRNENHEQYLHVQELVAEVDEKDRRIEQLEAELDEKGAIIRDLEMESDSQTQVSTEHVEAKQIGKVEPSDGEAKGPQSLIKEPVADEDAAFDMIPSDVSNAADPPKGASLQPEEFAKTSQELSAADGPAESTSLKKDAPDLELGDSDFPLFATRDTLKDVPPAPKPKKMSFPIDFSKYGKKSAQAPAAKQTEPRKGNGGPFPTFGLASKQVRVKTNAMPDFNPSLDIRQLDIGQRVIYANGPEVIVKMGEMKLATIPKYVLMQCSGKAYKHFTQHPDATSITFPTNSMDVDAAKAHLGWMDEMTYQGRVYSVTLNVDPKFDTRNLKICRAARVMGLNNAYVGHFTKQLCDRIRENDASSEFMNTVCELAYPENDPIFECLANNLVNQRMRKAIGKSDELAALLAKHDILKKTMEDIEKRVHKKRRNDKLTEGSVDPNGHKSRGTSNDRKAGKAGNKVKAEDGVKKFTIVR